MKLTSNDKAAEYAEKLKECKRLGMTTVTEEEVNKAYTRGKEVTMKTPLADRIRPKTLDEVVGQKNLIGEGKILRNIIENDEVPNMIFYGPSGVGKTTIANIIAQKTGKTLHRLNATTASVADIKNIVSTLDSFLAMDGVLLYIDEILAF